MEILFLVSCIIVSIILIFDTAVVLLAIIVVLMYFRILRWTGAKQFLKDFIIKDLITVSTYKWIILKNETIKLW
ncbi:hypothetical protein P148_SR1C00001G0659 [candidate division SR1 bacterium RAAC1_SR1_1]|nr:hypothetical protein P148_SR1C00001G0659 [candidate division SR1 bacterium RAAC1_SR1_1]